MTKIVHKTLPGVMGCWEVGVVGVGGHGGRGRRGGGRGGGGRVVVELGVLQVSGGAGVGV